MKIELTPHDALAIDSFLQEFREDMDGEVFSSLITAIDNFQSQVYKMADDQFNDAVAETKMNQLIGKAPKINKDGSSI